MIKLTNAEFNSGQPLAGASIWVSPCGIQTMRRLSYGVTELGMAGRPYFSVMETPEEIMASDAMVYHLHPQMYVNTK